MSRPLVTDDELEQLRHPVHGQADLPFVPVSGCGTPIVDRRCTTCSRWVLLDLYSCAGGAGMGYHRAGFCVTGVDIEPRPTYPFHHIVGDALEVLAAIGHAYAVVHGSPPCQAGTGPTLGTNRARNEASGREHCRLIAPTRAAFAELDVPTVIENVQTWASLGPELGVRPDLELCGEMFRLGVIRHRYFETTGFFAMQPPHSRHRGRVAGYRHGEWFEGPYFAVYGEGGGKGSVAEWQEAMGIDWTSDRVELAEAIPPAFTEFIGAALLEHVGVAA